MRKTATLVGIALVVFAAGMLAAIRPSISSAHTVGASITCSAVSFSYVDFASEATNTVHETVLVDGSSAYDADFSFTGSSGSHSVSLDLSGTHTVTAASSWDTNGHQGGFRQSATVECEETTTTETQPPYVPCIPRNPDGSPGGKDGKPGNDDCAEDETTTTTTTVSPPVETTTTPPPTNEETTTEETTTEETVPPSIVSENPPSITYVPPKKHTATCKAPAYMRRGECVRDFKGTPHPISRGSG